MHSVRRLCRQTALVSLALAAAHAAMANTAETGAAWPTGLSAPAVVAFADARMPPALRAGEIPGAVLTVVRGDDVICEKSYGVANVASGAAVSVSNTLFRAASISKILTAASVLELVQADKLDLNRDVNHYLAGWHIQPAFGEPVTLRDLLTHASGFDVDRLDYAARSAAGKLALRDYLIEFQPARVRPPGLFSVYNNYGFALAGYLVQKVSGIPFPQFEREKLLGPLDMNHSSFAPSPARRRELATGYWLDDGALRPCRPGYINITPAAGLCTTAADMARLLVALLADRRPDGARAFSTNVMAGLETQQFAFNPEVAGRCYGFDEVTLAGQRVLRQTGQWPGFNSELLLFPKSQCGLFLAYNRCDQLRLGEQISRQFAEIFFQATPDAADAPAAAAAGQSDLQSLCGHYLSVRFPEQSPDLYQPPEMTVEQSPDGNLTINGQLYRAVGSRVFEKIVPGGIRGPRVAFRLGDDGRVADLITESGAFRRAAWFETKHGRADLVLAASLVFLSVTVLWPVILLVRFLFAPGERARLRRLPCRHARLSLLAQAAAFITCALALWFELSLALTEVRLHPFAEFYGLPAAVKEVFSILPLLLGLTAALIVFSILIWRKRLWHPVHRLHYSLIPVALLVLLYIFYCRNLLFIA